MSPMNISGTVSHGMRFGNQPPEASDPFGQIRGFSDPSAMYNFQLMMKQADGKVYAPPSSTQACREGLVRLFTHFARQMQPPPSIKHLKIHTREKQPLCQVDAGKLDPKSHRAYLRSATGNPFEVDYIRSKGGRFIQFILEEGEDTNETRKRYLFIQAQKGTPLSDIFIGGIEGNNLYTYYRKGLSSLLKNDPVLKHLTCKIIAPYLSGLQPDYAMAQDRYAVKAQEAEVKQEAGQYFERVYPGIQPGPSARAPHEISITMKVLKDLFASRLLLIKPGKSGDDTINGYTAVMQGGQEFAISVFEKRDTENKLTSRYLKVLEMPGGRNHSLILTHNTMAPYDQLFVNVSRGKRYYRYHKPDPNEPVLTQAPEEAMLFADWLIRLIEKASG